MEPSSSVPGVARLHSERTSFSLKRSQGLLRRGRNETLRRGARSVWLDTCPFSKWAGNTCRHRRRGESPLHRLVEQGLGAWYDCIRQNIVKASRRLPKTSTVASVLAVLFGVFLGACSVRSGANPGEPGAVPSSDPTVKALAEFVGQVEEYARLHRSAALSLAPFQARRSATELWAREKLLADTIRARRPQAQEGDLFTAAVRPVLVGIVQRYLSSPEGAPSRDSIMSDNPVTETPLTPVVLAVNGSYEPAASFATMPATLLMRLPNLPEEVEYRFVGKHLLLRDTSANIILDYILDAAP